MKGQGEQATRAREGAGALPEPAHVGTSDSLQARPKLIGLRVLYLSRKRWVFALLRWVNSPPPGGYQRGTEACFSSTVRKQKKEEVSCTALIPCSLSRFSRKSCLSTAEQDRGPFRLGTARTPG